VITVSPITILLVEDNKADACLVKEAWKTAKVPNRISVVRDGTEALEFLHRTGDYTSAPRPDVIMLDLNLPGMNGHEVLADIKRDSDLRRIPVVVLTGSSADEDVRKAYDLHANCYITKPGTFTDLTAIIKSVAEFWGQIAVLPFMAA
jgi:two-component system, chemotaxis family, response regulator Rcp1